MFVCLVFVLLSYPVLRAYAARVEGSGAEAVEKVHRLRRIVYVQIAAAIVVGVLAAIETMQERHALPDQDWVRPVGRVATFVLLVAAIMGGQLALRPSYQRLRGIDPERARAARSPARTARSLILVAPMLVWIGVIALLVHLDVAPWVLLVAVVAMLLTFAILSPLLVRLAVPTAHPDERVRRLIGDLCDRAWVQLRDVRVIDTRTNPMANAMFAGFGPGPKYVFLTDVLIEELTDDQLEAVVAHEIGHLKGHHIAKRQGALLGAVVVLFGLVIVGFGTGDLLPRVLAVVLGLVALLLLPFVPFLVTGLVAIRQEKQADDYAANLVGARELAGALERLAEVNMMKRRTGRVWNLLTKHPGFEQRIERLRGGEQRAECSQRS